MKIRINGNSIRLRLSKTEVSTLISEGQVVSVCNFGNNCLIYKLVQGHFTDLSAQFTDDVISVFIPSTMTKNWENDDRIGFEYVDDEGLFIQVENDFQCLQQRPHEDEADLFPHPSNTSKSCDGHT
jgi:hypothetical protein